MIYLDNAATTAPCEEAIRAACDNMRSNFGNASSLHKLGIEAEKVLVSAKKTICGKLRAEGEVYFTSGATESNNTALLGVTAAYRHSGKRIVSTATEHPSVARVLDKLSDDGYEIVRLSPKDCEDFAEAIAAAVDENTVMVSAMAVNNETGYITDTAKLYRLVKRKNLGCIVHIDAVQGFCKVDVTGDLISLSAHKIHGIKGLGALFVKKGIRFRPLLLGGGQQKNLRSGTEPVDLIAGFEAAIKAYPDCGEHYRNLHDRLLQQIGALDGIIINSTNNVPNIVNFSVLGVRSEIMLHYLEERGIYISSGSACSKGKKSEVLTAYGIDDKRADSALRISFSRYNTESDVDALVGGIKDGIERFRR